MTFDLISPTALEKINGAIANLPSPGGMVRVYDAESRSVILICVEKRQGMEAATAWCVHGPCSEAQARQLLGGLGEPAESGQWLRTAH